MPSICHSRRRASHRTLLGTCAALVALAAALAWTTPGARASTGPALVGSVSNSTTFSGVTSAAVAGHYAYVTDYYAGKLSAVDISNPAEPVLVGSSPASAAMLNATTVNVAGGYAFVTAKNRNGPLGSESNDDGTGNSLTILDIASNPASPAIVGTIHDANTLFGSYGVAVSGHYAYVASQGCLSGQPCPDHSVGCAFAVIDISSPGAPLIVAALHSTTLKAPWGGTGALGHVTSLAISGNYAYVTAAYQSRLTVINISNPLSPRIVASPKDTTNFSFPVDVAVSGRYAYVINQTSAGRLAVVDVSDPTNPQIVAALANSALNGGYRIRLRGDFAYVSAASSGDVAVVDISNPLVPRLAASLTDSAHLYKTTGLDIDASGGHVIATSTFLANQSQPLYPPYALQPGGPTLTGTVSAITLDPEPIVASIVAASEPPNPTAQTSASFSFSANDAVAAMRCQLDGGGFQPCATSSGQSYAALGGGAHTFEAQATDAAGNTNVAAYSWMVTPPVNTELPALVGSIAVGEKLSATTGSWTGGPSFEYQWLRCSALGVNCLPIAGAALSSYTIEAADIGSTLAVQVSASTSAGATVAESPASLPVDTAPADTEAPSISGNAVQGETLTASPGVWSGYPPPTLAYQWERCDQTGANCTPIPEANTTNYTLSAADLALTIKVTVTATNSASSTSASSPASAIVTPTQTAPANTEAPSISGNAVQGQTLTASSGSWSGYPTPTLAYQWERCNSSGQSCVAIGGANSASYTALSADIGATLAVAVSATNTSGSTQARSTVSQLVSPAAGPLTPILDNFARPDNSGPPGPNWTHMTVSATGPGSDLFLTGGQVTGKPGTNADYWNPQAYGPNSEVWVTVATKPNLDLDPVVLGLRFLNPAAANASGYQAYYIFRSKQADQYKIICRVNGTTSITLTSISGPTLNPGDQLLFRAIGATLELWRGSAGKWTRILTASDGTYTGPGYLNLTARDGAVRLAGFGGGTLP